MTSVMPTAVRVSVTLLAVAGAAGQVAYLDALWWHALGMTETVARDVGSPLIVVISAHAAVSLVSAVLAVALVQHEGPRAAAARGLGTAFAAWSYIMAYPGVTMLFRPEAGLAQELFEGHFLAVEMIGLAGLVRFTALFPRPLLEHGPPPPVGLPPTLAPLHRVSVWMLRPSAPWLVGLVALLGVWGAASLGGSPSDAGLGAPMVGVRLLAAGLVVLNLRRSWGLADADGLRRLRWLAVSLTLLLATLALMMGANALVAVLGFPEPSVAWRPLLLDVGLVGFLGGLALSVLYAGPVEPLSVVRRVTSACTALTLGLFLAAGLEALLTGGILTAFSVRGGVGSALAFATIVSTYRGLERLVDRLMPQV